MVDTTKALITKGSPIRHVRPTGQHQSVARLKTSSSNPSVRSVHSSGVTSVTELKSSLLTRVQSNLESLKFCLMLTSALTTTSLTLF